MIVKLAALLGEKQTRENRVINVVTVAKETGIPKQTLYNWLSGDTTMFSGPIIEKLCRYFNCDVGDLLTIVEAQSDKQPELS